MLPSLLVHASGEMWERPRIFSVTELVNVIIAASTRASVKIAISCQPSDAGAAASAAGSDEAAAAGGGGAAAPFFFPIASITRARYEPGSLSRRTSCVA